MDFELIPTSLPDVFTVESEVFKDDRGYFKEIFRADELVGVKDIKPFVQDNLSYSHRSVLRGLHYQLKYPQAKLVTALAGEIFDVAVDLRSGSPGFGKWVGLKLSAADNRALYIPTGFAHGFCVLSDSATVFYKCSGYYRPEDDYGLNWADGTVGIEWPIDDPKLSDKDKSLPMLGDIQTELLPVYEPK